MTTEFNTPSARPTTTTSPRESLNLHHADHAEGQLGNGNSTWASQVDVFSKANLSDYRNAFASVADQVRKTTAQLPDTWIAFNDGTASPEKPDAKAASGSVKPVKELASGFDAVIEANKGKAPPYDFSSVAPDIKASALHAIRDDQTRDPQTVLSELQRGLNKAIKADHIGCAFTKNGDDFDMHMLQQLPKTDQAQYKGMSQEELAKQGLVRVDGIGVCKDLAKPEKIEIAKTEPEKLKAASEPITAAITQHKGADDLAKAFQDALNQGVPLSELMQSVNKSLPDNLKPAGGDAITARKSGDCTSIIVHPGIGGFTLDATEQNGKWRVQDSGEVLRDFH